MSTSHTGRSLLADRRSRRKEKTRGLLKESALALFAEHGVYDTRVEDVTERADVAKGGFYNYFASKDALVAELVSDAVRILEESYFHELPFSSPEAQLLAIVGQYQEFLDDYPVYALLLHQARGLLLLEREPPPALQRALQEHLQCLSRHLPTPPAAAADRLQIAALVAGTVAGYRSYVKAIAVEHDASLPQVVVLGGVARLLAERTAHE